MIKWKAFGKLYYTLMLVAMGVSTALIAVGGETNVWLYAALGACAVACGVGLIMEEKWLP